MSLASYQQSFLTNALIIIHKQPQVNPLTSPRLISCKASPSDELANQSSRKNENQLAKLAIVTLAAGVLTLGSVGDASAGKSGGRVGGQAFRSAQPPRSSGPRINNSRTNVYITPPVAPPLVGGYGYGYGGPAYYGGWSPFSFFAPGPSIAVGVGGGFETIFLFMFLGTVAAVVRKFFRSIGDDDEY